MPRITLIISLLLLIFYIGIGCAGDKLANLPQNSSAVIGSNSVVTWQRTPALPNGKGLIIALSPSSLLPQISSSFSSTRRRKVNHELKRKAKRRGESRRNRDKGDENRERRRPAKREGRRARGGGRRQKQASVEWKELKRGKTELEERSKDRSMRKRPRRLKKEGNILRGMKRLEEKEKKRKRKGKERTIGQNSRKNQFHLLSSSPGQQDVMHGRHLMDNICEAKPMQKPLLMKAEGCRPRHINISFCYGHCRSFYIPKSARWGRKERKKQPDARNSSNSPLGGSQHVFESCPSCKPHRVTWALVTFSCPRSPRKVRQKRVQIIKECRCIS